jgi:endonuclease V-like protein UPF0215 family
MSDRTDTPKKAGVYVIEHYGEATEYEQALEELVEDLENRVRALEAEGK